MRVFQVNVAYRSSWALYSCDKTTPLGVAAGDAPYAFSGKRATMDANDVGIQKSLKKWGPDFFKANNGVPDNMVVKLKDAAKASGSFDVNAEILQVFELDEYTNELKLKDDDKGTVCYALALKLKFPHLRAGQVVRIRSASYDTTSHSKAVLVLQHYSNIMTFISSSCVASKLGKISNDRSQETASIKQNEHFTPCILTEIDQKHRALPSTSLHDLFHAPDNSTSTFRTCFYITKVEPSNLTDAVKSWDKTKKKAKDAKGVKGGEFIYQMQFLCKDVSTQSNNNVYRILLYTHEGLGSNFFTIKP